MKKRILRITTIAVFVLAILAVLAVVHFLVFERLLGDLQKSKRVSLELITSALRSEIKQFEILSGVLASNHELQDYLSDPDAIKLVTINHRLQTINETTGALDTYLMDASGLTLAASNWSTDKSFVGKNFSYRPYFQHAINGSTGYFFAIGTTSKQRGFYIASPVNVNDNAIGAIVIKVQVDHFEQLWRSEQHNLSLIDDSGVIFLSTNPNWRLHSIGPLTSAQINHITSTRRYPNVLDISTLKYKTTKTLEGNDEIAQIHDNSSRYATNYLVMSSAMAQANWTVLLTTKTGSTHREAFFITVTIGFGLAGLAIIAYAIIARMRTARRRLDRAQSYQNKLEAAISERTIDLQNANIELLKTQQKLVQSSRLAAVGRFSAGLSHEINQPLTAMHSYLSNAQQLIKLERYEDANTKLNHIAALVDRITRIIQQLKIFVRGDELISAPVSLKSAVREALTVMESQADKLAAEVNIRVPENDVHINADEILVQQLIVNLLSNALDAAANSQPPIINITINKNTNTNQAVIEVSDNGAGVSAEHLANIFDPFYTTKGSGRGMGLGLTIAQEIVNRFHGELAAKNSDKGGAVFSATIPLYTRKTQ